MSTNLKLITLEFFVKSERPDTPSHLDIIEVSSRSVKLSWRRPFDGNSPVLSYIVQYQPLKYLYSNVITTEYDWNSPQTINITLPTIIGTRR